MRESGGRVRCEEVQETLPEYVEPGPRPAGPVELHLAGCPACREELASYRSLLSSLQGFRDEEVPIPPGYLDAVLHTARVASLRRLLPTGSDVLAASARMGEAIRRHGTGVRYVAATLGGAAAGATAIAIVWWSLARRAMSGAG
jgi:anti-sigma factor RsiW